MLTLVRSPSLDAEREALGGKLRNELFKARVTKDQRRKKIESGPGNVKSTRLQKKVDFACLWSAEWRRRWTRNYEWEWKRATAVTDLVTHLPYVLELWLDRAARSLTRVGGRGWGGGGGGGGGGRWKSLGTRVSALSQALADCAPKSCILCYWQCSKYCQIMPKFPNYAPHFRNYAQKRTFCIGAQ